MLRRSSLAILVALVMLVAAPAVLLADGNDHQKTTVTGTVSSVDSSSITVKTDRGSKSVPVNDKTKVTKINGDAAVMTDVQPGTSVVISLAPDGSAMEVHLVPANPPPANPPKY